MDRYKARLWMKSYYESAPTNVYKADEVDTRIQELEKDNKRLHEILINERETDGQIINELRKALGKIRIKLSNPLRNESTMQQCVDIATEALKEGGDG